MFDESRHPYNVGTPIPRQNSFIIAFKVEDIQATYKDLVARGVEFKRGIGEQEWGWYAHFQDLEGNKLQIYQPRAGFYHLVNSLSPFCSPHQEKR